MSELERLLLEYLPAHVRLKLSQEPAPVPEKPPSFDAPMPDASIFDKTIWSVEFVGLPPMWDYYKSFKSFNLVRKKT